MCLLLALPSGALAEGNSVQTPQTIKVERGKQVNVSKTVKSDIVTALADDFTGPVLDSATVSPTTVTVGEDLNITAIVSDDLSGVAEVVAYLNLPDGVGYKVLPLVQDPGTGEWKGTYTITDLDQNGTWTIDFDLFDVAGNYTFGDAGNTVEVVNSNGGDTSPPTLEAKSVSPLSVGPNEPVTIRATVNDNTAVDTVYAAIYTADSTGYYYLPLTKDETTTNEWVVTHTFSESDKSGAWYFDIDMKDTAGNFSWVTLEEELTLTNSFSDYDNPTIGEAVISPAQASPGESIKLSVPVTDALSGVSSVYAEFSHIDNPNEVYTEQLTHAPGTNEWTVDFNIQSSFPSGVWKAVVYATDVAGNSGFKEFFSAFDVINTSGDFDAPEITNVQVTPQGDVPIGGTVTITANVTDAVGLDMVYANVFGQEALVNLCR